MPAQAKPGRQPHRRDGHERADRRDVPGGVAVAARAVRVEGRRDEQRQRRRRRRARTRPARSASACSAVGVSAAAVDDRVERHRRDDRRRVGGVAELQRVEREHEVVAGEQRGEPDDEIPRNTDRHDASPSPKREPGVERGCRDLARIGPAQRDHGALPGRRIDLGPTARARHALQDRHPHAEALGGHVARTRTRRRRRRSSPRPPPSSSPRTIDPAVDVRHPRAGGC